MGSPQNCSLLRTLQYESLHDFPYEIAILLLPVNARSALDNPNNSFPPITRRPFCSQLLEALRLARSPVGELLGTATQKLRKFW